MSNTSMDLAERLRAAGITVNTGSSSEPENPWYVKALLALSAWVASLFLLVAVGAAFADLFDSRLALTISGLLLLAAAVLLLTRWRNDFNDNFGLALSLAGQVLLVFAINKNLEPDMALYWWAVCVFQSGLLVLPHFVHRLVVAAFGGVAFALALIASGLAHFAGSLLIVLLAFVWLAEFSSLRHMRLCQALGFGWAIALLCVQYIRRWQLAEFEDVFGVQGSGWAWLAEALTIAVLVKLILVVVRQSHVIVRPGQWAFIAVFIVCLSAASWYAYGLLQAVILLLLAFYGRNRVLFGLACVSLLLALSSYYYLLDTTLLIKSMTLLLLGILLLGARALFCYLWPNTKGDDARALEVEP